jgi:hypothetical protein
MKIIKGLPPQNKWPQPGAPLGRSDRWQILRPFLFDTVHPWVIDYLQAVLKKEK